MDHTNNPEYTESSTLTPVSSTNHFSIAESAIVLQELSFDHIYIINIRNMNK